MTTADEKILAGWRAIDPPEGFADRVTAACDRAARPKRKRAFLVGAVAVAAAMAIGFGVRVGKTPREDRSVVRAFVDVDLGVPHD